MSVRAALALLAMVLATAARGAAPPRFAVAGGDGADACVALPQGGDRQALQVAVPEPDGGAYRAHLGDRLPTACTALADAQVDGPFHALVFDGETPAGRWYGLVDRGGGAHASVLGCTSQEGLHLSAWAGAPRRSARLFHEYVYLGYDVDPTCVGGADTDGP